MKLRPGFVRRAVLIISLFLWFVVCVYIFFPSLRINTLIDQALLTQSMRLSPGAYKTILPGLAWDNALLSSPQGPLFHFDHISVRPQLLQLLTGRVVLSAVASLKAGRLNIDHVISGRQSILLVADKLPLDEMPFFRTVLGAKVGGSLWSEGYITRGSKGWNGEVKLEISKMEFSGIKMGGFPLPDTYNLNSKGMVRITDGKARLESLTLQGDGVFMRLSGNLPLGVSADAAPLDLVLEIMPKPDFLDKQKLVFLLLAKFMASPGVYRVPIKGTLMKPEII